MKKSLTLSIIFYALSITSLLTMLILGLYVVDNENLAIISIAPFLIFMALGTVFLFLWATQSAKAQREEAQRKWEALSDEEKAEIELKKKQEQEERAKATTIEKTRIIGQDTRKSTGSSVVRGAVGGALFGVAGAVGGAMSGKNKQSIIFYVTYKDGHSETKTAEIDSDEYKKYMIYLEQ